MRHLFVATTMILVALVVTFGTASVLQGVATAKGSSTPEPFVVEAKPAKPAPAKERVTFQSRDRIRSAAASW
jgi:hypothetical protein